MNKDASKTIVLIGMMGAGKTTVGRALAVKLGKSFVDNDHEVERRSGLPPADLLRKDEGEFRRLESELIVEQLSKAETVVLSVGGGAPVSPVTRQAMRERGFVIWLSVPVEELLKRLTQNQLTNRPMLDGNPEQRLRSLMADRLAIYEEVADMTIEAGDLSPEELAVKIVEMVETVL